MVIIESNEIKVRVNPIGAELDSIFSSETKIEYLWSGDPDYWPKKSPVLFPIVGRLKENTYYYNNKKYHLPRHGFARDMDFEVTAQSGIAVTLSLHSDDSTLTVYPFPFRLDISYTALENGVHVQYVVTNKGDENMYFSIGGHPAFRVPLQEGLLYDDYYFEFEQREDALRWMVSREGLIEPTALPFIINDDKLKINRELFRNDAIVFKYLNSHIMRIKSNKSPHGVEVHFTRFPFIGLWAAPNADFVCIEPWCGIADSTTTKQQLIHKEGINLLTPQESFIREWTAKVY
jgi:galactose mutarotase-like enzyme